MQIEDRSSLKTLSQDITAILIDPVKEHLKGIDHLVISPDGGLHLLPFEALLLDDTYLIERYSVKYVPSMSVYDVIDDPRIRVFDNELLAMASTDTPSSLSTLAYAMAEVDSISTYYSNSTILKHKQASEDAFKNLPLSGYRIIHLAAHGRLDEHLPDQSGLMLAAITSLSPVAEDGYLNAREIAQMDINSELVVLSACNTGKGRVIHGEGVLGLQRAFLSAGASSVMVSLWNIFDRSTPVFMDTFYRELVEAQQEQTTFMDMLKRSIGVSASDLVDYKTLALQRAKNKMIKHPYYHHPVHWAPFILTGK